MIVRHLSAAVFCFSIGIPVLIAVQSIRVLGYDVMGGRAFPTALAVLLLMFGVIRLVQGLMELARSGREKSATVAFNPRVSVPRPHLRVLAATLIYMTTILFGIADFLLLSALYMFCSGLLARRGLRAAVEAVVITGFVIASILLMEQMLGLRLVGR